MNVSCPVLLMEERDTEGERIDQSALRGTSVVLQKSRADKKNIIQYFRICVKHVRVSVA